MNSINLLLRFLLELAALFALGLWGKNFTEGWLAYLLAVGLPLLVASVWGTFAVPEDPSRSGKAPLPVSGLLRLMIELLIFAIAVWSLYDLALLVYAWILGVLVSTHYVFSYDRIKWLLKR